MILDYKPDPDFARSRRALTRAGELDRVSLLELFADPEVIAEVMGVTYAPPADAIEQARWTRIEVQFWYELGYDAFLINPAPTLPPILQLKRIAAEDTAALTGAPREWHRADEGLIRSWDDFEEYPWPRSEDADYSQLELAAQIMPDGMKILPTAGGILEPVMWLMGYAPFALALYDTPNLIVAMIEKLTEIAMPVAETLLDMDCVGGLFIGDDMGFRTATMIAPDDLRKYFFPYHKRIAQLAHEHGKVYVLHACGNLEAVLDDLIDDVGIDAKHSFEDAIMPVTEFKARYGRRVGVVGGLDIGFLSRASEDEVRARVRHTLESCMPGGGYLLGTGNSVANYIPVRNFLAMVDEGHRWRPA